MSSTDNDSTVAGGDGDEPDTLRNLFNQITLLGRPHVRAYLYRVAVAIAVAVSVASGTVVDNAWLEVIAAILAIGGNGLAAIHTPRHPSTS